MPEFHIAKNLIFDKLLTAQSEQISFFYKNNEFSYLDIALSVYDSIENLEEIDVKAGDTVVLFFNDSPAFVSLLFALSTLGALAIPVNPNIQENDLLHILENATVSKILAFEDFKENIEKILNNFTPNVKFEIIYFKDIIIPKRCINQDELFILLIPKLNYNPYCYILYSSGTTGKPKGIPRKHSDIQICFNNFGEKVLQMKDDDRTLAIPKLPFGYGLGSCMFSCLSGGSYILNPDKVTIGNFISLVNRYKPTILILQPRMIIEILANNIKSEVFDTVRVAITAGEALPESLLNKWSQNYDIDLLDGFGSTEVGHIFISNMIGNIKKGTPGRLLGDYEIKIVNNDFGELLINEIGRLWIRGESVVSKYWNDIGRSELAFVNEGFLSDDLFYKDDEDYLYPVGRADDMIKTGCGEWIIPARIETVLSSHPHVDSAILVGSTNNNGLTITRAYVLLKENYKPNELLANELQDMIKESWPLLDHYRINEVVFLSDFPKTINGKIDRNALKKNASVHTSDFNYEC